MTEAIERYATAGGTDLLISPVGSAQDQTRTVQLAGALDRSG